MIFGAAQRLVRSKPRKEFGKHRFASHHRTRRKEANMASRKAKYTRKEGHIESRNTRKHKKRRCHGRAKNQKIEEKKACENAIKKTNAAGHVGFLSIFRFFGLPCHLLFLCFFVLRLSMWPSFLVYFCLSACHVSFFPPRFLTGSETMFAKFFSRLLAH